jgi:hypothetical protein
MALKEVTIKADGRRAMIRPEDFSAAIHKDGYGEAKADAAEGQESDEAGDFEPEEKPKGKKGKKAKADAAEGQE